MVDREEASWEVVQRSEDDRSWQWLRGGFLDKRTEGFVCASQETVKTTCYTITVMKKEGDRMCKLCGKYAETSFGEWV